MPHILAPQILRENLQTILGTLCRLFEQTKEFDLKPVSTEGLQHYSLEVGGNGY